MMTAVGDLEPGDEVELVMTVPARVLEKRQLPGGDWMVRYERVVDPTSTFLVPYPHASTPAEDAQDRTSRRI